MSRVVNQRYTLLRLLGRGGMGEVFLAADRERPQAPVALKYLVGAAAGSRPLREEFLRMSRLRHPNLIQVYDLETDAERGEPFIVMEYAPGEDFCTAARRAPLAEIIERALQVCAGLGYLHSQGLAHRDLKPENLIVTPAREGDGARVRLLDFGLAADPRALQGGGEAPAGTLPYMAPELFRGEWVDHRADLYSLGMVLYQAAAGRLPFTPDSGAGWIQAHLSEAPSPPSAWRPGLDAGFEAVVMRLLRKRPAERYQSAAQVEEDLRRLAGAALLPASPAPWQRSPRLVGREAEVSLLQRLLAAIVAPEAPATPPLLFLHGPPGSGKSRLLEEARRLARAQGIEVRWLSPGADPAGGLEEAGASGPALLLIDDLHRADADALRRLARRLRRREGERLAVVLSSGEPAARLHPDLHSLCDPEEGGSEVELRPLEGGGVRELIASILRQPDPAAVPELLVRQAAGNPRFAVEWTLSLVERRIVEWREGAPRIDLAALEATAAPSALVELAAQRLHDLSVPATALLRALTALGRPCGGPEAAAVSGLEPESLAAAAAELRNRGLLASAPAEGEGGEPDAAPLALPHAALADAVRRQAGEALRPFHTRAAELCEAAGTDASERAAHHWREAGALERVRPLAIAAAARAEAAGDSGRQVRLLEWALEATPAAARRERVSLLHKIVQAHRAAHFFQGSGEAARRLLAEAEQETEHAPLVRDTLVSLHSACARLSKYDEAERLAERIETLLRAHPDPALEARYRRDRATHLAGLGRTEEALPLIRRASELYREAGLQPESALCLHNLGSFTISARSPAEAEPLLREAASLLRECGDPRVGFPLGALGMAEALQGRWEESVRLAREARDHHLRAGTTGILPTISLWEGVGLHGTGRLDEALSAYEEAIRLSQREGLANVRLEACELLGNLHRLLGSLQRARQLHEQGLRLARKSGPPAQIPFLAAALSEDLLAAGDPAAARPLAQEAIERADAQGHRRARLRAGLALARLRLEEGDMEQGREALEFCRQVLRPEFEHADSARIEELETRLRLRLEERTQAAAALARGLEHARAGSLWWSEAALLALAVDGGLLEPSSEQARRLPEILETVAGGIADPAVAGLVRSAPAWRDAVGRVAAASRPQPATGAFLPERQALRTLAEMGRILRTVEDPRRLASTLLESARSLVGADRALLVLTGPDGGGARAAASSDLEAESEPEALEFSRVALARGLEKPLLVLDAPGDPDLRASPSIERFDIRSIACLPLRVSGALVGAIYLDSRGRALEAGPAHLRLLEAFAHQAAAALDSARSLETLRSERERLRGRARERYRFHALLGRSPAMQQVYDLLEPFSKSDLPVLITGESGTGKELVARALHWNGPRRDGPFVAESCAAIPETLLESELFGHVRGAFTGAEQDRRGMFAEASGGTLFLDEIGEMTPPLQAKLLRAIQEKEIRPLGAARALKVDARIVAATHRDLGQAAREGAFREDLLYRLRVLTLRLPPLRERLEDLPLLARHFLAEHRREHGRGPVDLAPEVLERLGRCAWPGNVRELRGEVLKMAMVASGERVERRDLESHPELFASILRPARRAARPPAGTLRDLERRQVERALEAAQGDKEKAARLLGLSRATLYRKLKRYRIGAAAGR
jgi:transcriptional regulator with GAF, ATPase, and Fis domain/tetratricopeptide (TPR) repeat protein